MKKILFLLFVLLSFLSKAQIVTIPDANFKNILLNQTPNIDINADHEIQVSEATLLTSLFLPTFNNITDLTGINSFVNLDSFRCSNVFATTLDISGLINLEYLEFSSTQITGTLTLANLPKLKNVICPLNLGLTSIALNNLPLLNNLNCKGGYLTNPSFIGNITSLNITAVPDLDSINCNNNKITVLNLSGLNLTKLECDSNLLTSLNLSGQTNLKWLSYSQNQLTNVDLSSISNLLYLKCSSNNISSLNLSGNPNLTALFCNNNLNITSLNINSLPALRNLNCSETQVASLDLSNCPFLETFECDNINLTQLDFSNCPNMLSIYCPGVSILNKINVTGLGKLTTLWCTGSLIDSLDVSTCTSLTSLAIQGNQRLKYLNVKNGRTPTTINVNMLSVPIYVCADDSELIDVSGNFFFSGTTYYINSYCSFVPGGSYNTINGTLRIDADNNGCDASDPVIPQVPIKITNSQGIGYTSTDGLGNYKFYTNGGDFTITPQQSYPYFIFSPASVTLNFATGGGNTQTADFCLTPNGTHPDLEVSILSYAEPRPGFEAVYKLVYKNKGTGTLSGNVDFGFNNAKMNLITSVPAAITQSTGSLTWAYTNLKPFESRSIDVWLTVLAPPVNNINDTLTVESNITPLVGDETALDNNFTMKQVIRGSYDPNDKICLEGPKIDVIRVGDYIHYLVRFQNTGNYFAENVVVQDLLQSNVDWNTVELVKTSHPCVFKQTEGNKLEFIFEGINLPAQSVDEPGSHGFVSFKVRTIGSLVLGDQVTNNASIYFDFNLPVITNTVSSVISENVIVPITIEYFKGSIQSGKHLLNWKADCTSIQATFSIERSTDGRNFINLGNITASNTRCLQPFDFTDNNPAAGINYYRIKMIDVDGKTSYSSVIVLLNKKTGFEIVNLVPNPVTDGTASLNITSAEKQIVNIKITDASGKIIQSMDQPVISGFTQLNMNFNKLAAGVYTIIIYTNDGKRKTKQFIKQ